MFVCSGSNPWGYICQVRGVFGSFGEIGEQSTGPPPGKFTVGWLSHTHTHTHTHTTQLDNYTGRISLKPQRLVVSHTRTRTHTHTHTPN